MNPSSATLAPRRVASYLAAVATMAAVTGCGASDEDVEADGATGATASPTASADVSPGTSPSPAPTPSATASELDPDAVTIKLTVRGESIKPGPKVVKVQLGKPVVFVIDSDRAGGLHVHSSPEQTPSFKKGRSSILITLDMPGVVEVEEHEADALVAQLEVR